jgi:hypothetical protein
VRKVLGNKLLIVIVALSFCLLVACDNKQNNELKGIADLASISRLAASGEYEEVIRRTKELYTAREALTIDELKKWAHACVQASQVGAEPEMVEFVLDLLSKNPDSQSLKVAAGISFSSGASRFQGYKAGAQRYFEEVINVSPLSEEAMLAREAASQFSIPIRPWPITFYVAVLIIIALLIFAIARTIISRNGPSLVGILDLPDGQIHDLAKKYGKNKGIAIYGNDEGCKIKVIKSKDLKKHPKSLMTIVPSTKTEKGNYVYLPSGGVIQWEHEQSIPGLITYELINRNCTIETEGMKILFSGLEFIYY